MPFMVDKFICVKLQEDTKGNPETGKGCSIGQRTFFGPGGGGEGGGIMTRRVWEEEKVKQPSSFGDYQVEEDQSQNNKLDIFVLWSLDAG